MRQRPRLRRALPAVGLALVAAVATGCSANPGPLNLGDVSSVNPPMPGGLKVGNAALPAPAAAAPDCGNPTVSPTPLAPLPAPNQMPTGTTMATIQKRGYLIAGVDQNTYLFGYRSPTDNQLEGFDIDIVNDIATAIFGKPNVQFKAITSSQRTDVLKKGQVDVVVRTFTVSCARKQDVDFSSVYYQAQRRLLVAKSSSAQSIADMGGKRICATIGSDSLAGTSKTNPPIPVAVNDWSDCLVMLQQGEVDGIVTDDAILDGMLAQDPNTKIVGPSIAPEPYGVAIQKGDTEFVRFVNGVLDQVRQSGRWQASYTRWLGQFGGNAQAPTPTYAG